MGTPPVYETTSSKWLQDIYNWIVNAIKKHPTINELCAMWVVTSRLLNGFRLVDIKFLLCNSLMKWRYFDWYLCYGTFFGISKVLWRRFKLFFNRIKLQIANIIICVLFPGVVYTSVCSNYCLLLWDYSNSLHYLL